jgi:archaeal flagellar protein FlaI
MGIKGSSVDRFFDEVRQHKQGPLLTLAKQANVPYIAATKIAHYLEDSGLVRVSYTQVTGPHVEFLKDPEMPFDQLDEAEIIDKLKFYKGVKDIRAANKLVMDLFNVYKRLEDPSTKQLYEKVRQYYVENFMKGTDEASNPVNMLESYEFQVQNITAKVEIVKQPLEAVPFYLLSQLKINDVTRVVIERIKEQVVSKIISNLEASSREVEVHLKHQYEEHVLALMKEIFTDMSPVELQMFSDYVIITSLGMGEIEFLLKDSQLEEIVINNSHEPVRIYHKKYGWMQTNVLAEDDNRIVHYATLAGRNVDKTITTLQPLMDAHLKTGDRVNATLMPISTKGTTMTIRKFAESPWTITDFISSGTIDYYTAALIWTAIQYELSILIVGGTGSGKTSALNVFSLFIVPNQRIVSIEDTRELRLPSTLHWVPLETRLPNPEGKGEVSMLDLVVNSLRMRPDRIIVGEIRRKKEAEVLFEAMHTGHSVYATLHANTVEEAVIRITTDPIGISKTQLGALDLMVVQNRNRRTNQRRTFQLAEMRSDGTFNLLYNYDFDEDALTKVKDPVEIYKRLELFAGLKKDKVDKEVQNKVKILKHLVKNNIRSIEEIGLIISYYYTDPDYLMNRLFGKDQ